MRLVNPEEVHLVPGESIEAIFRPDAQAPDQIGFFVRSASGIIRPNGDLAIEQRAGLVRFDDVLLVVTMIKVGGETEEYFDIWWNYHSPGAQEHFRRLSEQEKLTVHFYDEDGEGFSISIENSFRKFFSYVPGLIEKSEPWTEIEFDRAVRGFCAQSYPKENLWDMIEFRPQTSESAVDGEVGIENYQGIIPDELRPFYDYVPDQGHCIKIIPSILEQEAVSGNPDEYLYPAPVKTVLRCGIRWARGYPVAPIPFIPGHGLAVPPDDVER